MADGRPAMRAIMGLLYQDGLAGPARGGRGLRANPSAPGDLGAQGCGFPNGFGARAPPHVRRRYRGRKAPPPGVDSAEPPAKGPPPGAGSQEQLAKAQPPGVSDAEPPAKVPPRGASGQGSKFMTMEMNPLFGEPPSKMYSDGK